MQFPFFAFFTLSINPMKISKSIIISLSLLLWGWLFGFVWAQQNTDQSVPILTWTIEEHIYQINSSTLSEYFSTSPSFEQFYHKIRIALIKSLMEGGYSGFNNEPYPKGSLSIIAQSWDFKVVKNIEGDDGLDIFLKNNLSGFQNYFESIQKSVALLDFKNIEITTGTYAQLWALFMFKNEQDLRDLWYELISWKSRTNTDPDYRKHNIKTAFNNIGNVRLIMPDETFSLAREFHYSSSNKGSRPYVFGYATVGAGVKMVYGGWLCGVATAFFQGTLTNLWFELVQYRAHSIYYRNLYEAEINGEYIKDPWLDATVFAPKLDLKVKNIRDYPIVAVFNFDGLNWSNEQVFTLSKAQDRGSFEYIGTYKKWSSSCFTWKINGEDRTNCYTHVKNF